MKKTAAVTMLAVAVGLSGCAATLSDTDAMYLENVRDRLADNPESVMVDAADAELIAAAHDACDQMQADGVLIPDVELDADAADSAYIAARASIYYCEGAAPSLHVAIYG